MLPFDDKRDATNYNRLLLYLIPLMPYGWADYKAPEGATMHVGSSLWINYKPTEDFPKALAQELTDTGRYKEAHFGFSNDNADYVVKGQILNTDYYGTMISYGLTPVSIPDPPGRFQRRMRSICVGSRGFEHEILWHNGVEL